MYMYAPKKIMMYLDKTKNRFTPFFTNFESNNKNTQYIYILFY